MVEGSQPRHRRVTIYDVAHEAGVAPSTVSRSFSKPGRVNAETAERVRQVADRLGYRTSPVTRPAAGARSHLIAVVITDITNPVFAEITRAVQEVASLAGYTTVLIDGRESDRAERQALGHTLGLVDGVVLAGTRMSDSAIRMISKQRPVVVLNRAIADVPSVVADYSRGLRLAVGHLHELGHDQIVYVAGPEASWANGVRWRSLLEVAAQRHLRVRRIGPFTPDLDGGEKAAAELQSQPAGAVITHNDQMAVGFVRALTRMGWHVPRDMSVVGFDNTFAAEVVTPRLTTVAAPLVAQGTAAARHLLTMVDGAPGRTGAPMVLPVHLVVRDSTSVPRRTAAVPLPPDPDPLIASVHSGQSSHSAQHPWSVPRSPGR